MMIKPDHTNLIFSALEPGTAGDYPQLQTDGLSAAALALYIEDLRKANADVRAAKLAALAIMEEAILSKEVLRMSDQRTGRVKEAFQSAVNGAPLTASLRMLTRLAEDEMPGSARTAFYIVNETSTGLYTLRGAGNMPDTYADEIDGFAIGTDSLACGLAVPTGKPVITPDVHEDERWKPWRFIADKYGYRGCWSFPIKTLDDKAVGTFALYFKTRREPAPEDVDLADVITKAAAVIISSYIDARERARMEAALQKSEEKYRSKLEQEIKDRTAEVVAGKQLLQATMDASLDMIQVFEAVRNRKGEIIDFRWLLNNHAAEKYYGNVIGKRLLKQNPGVVQEGIFDTFKQVVETGIPAQNERYYVHEQFNGWYFQSVVKLDDGVATTTINITEKKKAEQEVKKQASYIEHITQTVPGMISVMELSSGKIEYTNDIVVLAQGFDPEKMKNAPRGEMRKAIHPDDQDKIDNYYAAFHTLKNNEAVTADYRAKTDAGNWQWFRIRGKVFQRNVNGVVTHIVNNIENITKEKEAEEKISQLNTTLVVKNKKLESANTEIRTFNNVAATDYNETLRQLYTSLEYVATTEARHLSDSGKANIRRAQSAIQKMKLLTDDIVNFSKIHTPESQPARTDLNELIGIELADAQRRVNPDMLVTQANDLPVINGYPLLLSLLFHHLIDNAIKFTIPGQPALLNIAYKQPEPTPVAGMFHRIVITDHGIGFPQDEAEKIFGMFYRLHPKNKYRGSGVGLAICRKIMDLHHGFISAESEPGKGASLTCHFPVSL